MITKHDDKNLKYHRWILQLGNVQKKPYIIMNIMYTTLHLHKRTNNEKVERQIISRNEQRYSFFLHGPSHSQIH